MTSRAYLIHGFVLDSELELDALRAENDATAELVCRLAGADAAVEPVGADIVAERRDALNTVVAWRRAHGHVLRFSDVADFYLEDEGASIEALPRRLANTEVLSLLLTGAVMTFLINLRGGVVLHASGCALPDGSALVLAGMSGSGKTTAAAWLSAGGLPLIGDDAIRVDRRTGTWVAFAGSPALRLRAPARKMSALFGSAHLRTSADGRLVVIPGTRAIAPSSPLRAILIPSISGVESTPRVATMDRASAAVELLRSLRFGSWTDPAVLEQQTRSIAELVRDVPVSRLWLPRSMAHDRATAESLRMLVTRELGVVT